MFGTTARAGNGAASAPRAEGQAGAATIADAPAGEAAGDPAGTGRGRHAAAAGGRDAPG